MTKEEVKAEREVYHEEHAEDVAHDDVVDHKLERKLLFKLDALILPLTALLYLSAFLDRGNAGNAKLQGMLDIFGDDADHKFSIVLMSFYITYIVLNVPGNILCTILQPNYALAIAALTWGLASTAQAGAHNFAGVVVCRLFIGIGEAGFGSAVPLYYGLWYRRDEIATRISLYVGAGSLSGAFGGLIAYGVSFIRSHIDTWRILFLIEGLPTIALAAVIVIFLPGTPQTSRYITSAERDLTLKRLGRDTGVTLAHKFDKSAFGRVFHTRTTYLNGLVYLGLNLSLGSVSGFLPTIIKTFGFSNARAQLMTVPPYAVAFVGTVTISYMSDRLRMRGPFVVTLMLLSAVGFAILIAVPTNNAARYFATFLVVLGAFSNIPLMLSWAGNTAGSHSAAAVRLGFMNAFVLASFIFPANEGPHWYKGFGLNLAFNFVAGVTAAYLSFYYYHQNKKRDAEENINVLSDREDLEPEKERPAAEVSMDLHDLTPGFRYYM